MKIEYEVRYYPVDIRKDQITEMLGDSIRLNKYSNYNRIVFDIDKNKNLWARVRYDSHEEKTSLTIKKSNDSTTVDGTEEFEIYIEGNRLEELSNFFFHMGFTNQLSQENYRYWWNYSHQSQDISYVTLDIWPGIGPVLEIESTCEENIIEIESKLSLKKENRFPGDIPDIYVKKFNILREEFKNIKNLTFEKYRNN